MVEIDYSNLNREELMERILWNKGGMGFGVCRLAGMLLWGEAGPEPKSIVAVSGPSDKYTDEELRKITRFSDERTAEYDKMFTTRRGANVICINKVKDDIWMRKRLTWEYGPMNSPTLDKALAVFNREGV